ncbi:hypothetical protein MTO96_021119 [Rhipicephalus appendiculatus]
MAEPCGAVATELLRGDGAELSGGGDSENADQGTGVDSSTPSEPIANAAPLPPSTSPPSHGESSQMLFTEEEPTRPHYYIDNILLHQRDWHTELRFASQQRRRRPSVAWGGWFERCSLYWKQLRRDYRCACALDAFFICMIIAMLFVLMKVFMDTFVRASYDLPANVTRV